MKYKFTDSTKTVVLRIDDDGLARVSLLVDAEGPYQTEFNAWIAEGNAPLPPDEPPVETP
jgi:hypothetical protein